jgi:predicted transposase YbfD/YdcC
MNSSPLASIETHFRSLTDPRAEHSIKHYLIDIVMITICAVICGADNWVDIENYGHAKIEWLKEFLELPHGIPSHDTLMRVFARLKPEQLQQCFLNWIQAVSQITQGQVIAIDGKSLRSARERGQNRGAIHMVSAWATENRLVLGQQKVNAKSNEITAIPELLKLLTIEGCLVSIDAMGCQTEIARTIIEQRGDYVLALKANQRNLYEDVVQLFQSARQKDWQDIDHEFYQTINKGHGRIEIRRYWIMEQTEYLLGAEQWSGLKSIGLVESQRRINNHTTLEHRYYLLSIQSDAQLFAQAVRSHWGIENQLHWVLDVSLSEDIIRGCEGYSAENLAVVRHLAVNLLTHENTAKGGIHAKRKQAGWNNQYLTRVLNSFSDST